MNSSQVRANVLNVYKNLIKLAKNVTPNSQSLKMLTMIRNEFRNPEKQNLDSSQIRELLIKAQSNISYLKMITPKDKNHKDNGETTKTFNNNDSSNKMYSNNRVHSNWTGTNMDPDSIARHNASLKRAGFRNNNHAKGGYF